MELSLEIIKSLSSKEYLEYRKEIHKYLQSLRPIKKVKNLKPLTKSLKNINSNIRAIHIIKTDSNFSDYNSQSKLCTKCKEFKLLSEFNKHGSWCKECKNHTSAKHDIVILKGTGKECNQCLDFKTWDKYVYCKGTNDRKSSVCRDCISLNAKLRLWTDINLRLSSCLRKRINSVLKGKSKSANTMELIGCSIDYLKNHLENRFQPGMSWDNYGRGDNNKQEWHVDHLIPCCKFDLTKEDEQRKCFHFSNLQPLWSVDNIKKGGR